VGGPAGPGTTGSLAQEWNKALKDDEFVARVPNTRLKAWEEYFKWAQGDTPLSAEQQENLSWLRHGVKIEWMEVDSKAQKYHPRYGQRRQHVLELLSNTLCGKGQRVRELLEGKRPGKVQFANRKSVQLYEAFVKTSLGELLSTRALREVAEEQVHVCSGLGVAANRKGKLRLILDARLHQLV
jgi:hypothetical protein